MGVIMGNLFKKWHKWFWSSWNPTSSNQPVWLRYTMPSICFLHIPVLGSWSPSHSLEVFSLLGTRGKASRQATNTMSHVATNASFYHKWKTTTPAWFSYHVLHASNRLHNFDQWFPDLRSQLQMSHRPKQQENDAVICEYIFQTKDCPTHQ